MTPVTDSIKILYIEDQPGNISGVEKFLAPYPQYQLQAINTLENIWQVLADHPPDVLLLDLGLGPEQNIETSIKFLQEAKTKLPQVTFLVYSTIGYLNAHTIREVLKSGVSYLVKEAVVSGEKLHQAIQIAQLGSAVYSEAVVAYFEELLNVEGNSPLSDRELEVASLIQRGLPNKKIADLLGLKEARVRAIVTMTLRKLGLTNRTEIALWVTRNPQLFSRKSVLKS